MTDEITEDEIFNFLDEINTKHWWLIRRALDVVFQNRSLEESLPILVKVYSAYILHMLLKDATEEQKSIIRGKVE